MMTSLKVPCLFQMLIYHNLHSYLPVMSFKRLPIRRLKRRCPVFRVSFTFGGIQPVCQNSEHGEFRSVTQRSARLWRQPPAHTAPNWLPSAMRLHSSGQSRSKSPARRNCNKCNGYHSGLRTIDGDAPPTSEPMQQTSAIDGGPWSFPMWPRREMGGRGRS